MDMIAYAAILAVIAPLSVMTWLVVTGDRAGLRNIQSNLGNRPQTADRRSAPRDSSRPGA